MPFFQSVHCYSYMRRVHREREGEREREREGESERARERERESVGGRERGRVRADNDTALPTVMKNCLV